MMDIRTLFISLMTGLLAFLHPIGNFMIAAVILLGLNYLCGLIADIVNGGKWSFHKSMLFFWHAFLFFGIACSVFTIGHFMNNEKGAVQCVSYLCYAGIYFFGTNIFRNIRELLTIGSPMYNLINFIYYVISFQFTEKLPLLKDYLRSKGGIK